MNMEKMKIEACKDSLKRKGFFIENLWHTDDVIQNYKCDESEAQNVLYSVFDSEWLIEQIFEMIDEQCKAKGIERK